MKRIVFHLGDMIFGQHIQSWISKNSFYPILALTATADKATRKDISQQLNLKNRNYLSFLDRKI
jgi:superfamily II DNA helicase RecQ